MTGPVLVCDRLSVSYRTRHGIVPAVVDFDLEIGPGEAVGLVGESGCGKSTVALAILRHLGRNGHVVGGGIRFKDEDVLAMDRDRLRRLRGGEIAMVYQEPMASLNPALTIGRQLVEVPIHHEGVDRRRAEVQARLMLERVRLADAERVMRAYPHQLSGGQQQRVVIAMALLSRPTLLLLDEPTTALDVTVEAGIVELIRDLAAETGTSMLYISHNLGLIRETCTRMVVMYAGEAVEMGSVAQVFERMRHPYTRGLFLSIPRPGADKHARPLVPIAGQPPLPRERPSGCAFGPRCTAFRAGTCDQGRVAMVEVGGAPGHASRCRRIAAIDWDADPAPAADQEAPPFGATALEVRGLTKHYRLPDRSLAAWLGRGRGRTVKANQRLDLDARQAETVAIVGESGCGKTTFAKVLMGLETATEGQILVQGRDVGRLPVQRRGSALVAHLQMVFQNPSDTLNPSRTVGAQVGRVLRKFGVVRGHAAVRARVLELLDMVKLPREFHDRLPRQLSGGQKQRVGIARAFAGEPKVVVADEPVSALDVSVQAAVTQLLMDIQAAHRTTLLVISHDLALVRYLADRVAVMYLGHIVEQGPTAAVFAPPYHPYTEALLSAVPVPDTRVVQQRIVLQGELPSAIDPPAGCPFHTRCHRKIGPICETEPPPLRELAPGHRLACHLDDTVLRAMRPVLSEA